MSAAAALHAHFDDLFRTDNDPWRTRTSWYEERKRTLTLAMLPAPRYLRAFEPGCGVGELTAALAERCDQIVATDACAAAVAHARHRIAHSPTAEVEQGSVPDDWPDGRFDLIVVSELGYYLVDDALARLSRACGNSLGVAGTLLACHWRHAEPDMLQTARAVHTALGDACPGRHLCHYEDDDLLLDLWSTDERSVAKREGPA